MDRKAMKKTAALAAVGIALLIPYLLIPTFDLHPMIEALLKTALGVLALSPLLGAAVALVVLGVRYFFVISKAIERDKDYPKSDRVTKSPTKKKEKMKKTAESAREDSDIAEQKQRWDQLFCRLEKGELKSPAADLVRYYDKLHGGTHAQYLDHVAQKEALEETVYAVFSVLPSPLKENLARAYAAKTEEYDELSLDTILTECDAVFRDNEGMIQDLIQDVADGKPLQKATQNDEK